MVFVPVNHHYGSLRVIWIIIDLATEPVDEARERAVEVFLKVEVVDCPASPGMRGCRAGDDHLRANRRILLGWRD